MNAPSSGACAWCEGPLPEGLRSDAVFCKKACRQRAWRLRGRRVEVEARALRAHVPLRMAYADPPYPGLARRYYQGEPTFAGEVDHVALIARLQAFDGWALSTGGFALRELLPLCPDGARVCPWVKPGRRKARTYGLHNGWEALIVVPGRRLRPGVVDWLFAAPARLGGSSLKGRKPLAFVGWLFDCLGLLPGDELEDLFPGSGVVGSAWREASRGLERGRVAPPAAATRRADVDGDAPAEGVARRPPEAPVATRSSATRVACPRAATGPVARLLWATRRGSAAGDVCPSAPPQSVPCRLPAPA
jgi:hypothetical protein